MYERFIEGFVLVTFGPSRKTINERNATKMVYLCNVLYQYKASDDVFIPPNIGFFCFPEKLTNYNLFLPKFNLFILFYIF
jgi:hypothetical protein